MRPFAAVLEAGLAFGGVAPQPFAQGDLGDAAAAADDPSYPDLLVEPDPAGAAGAGSITAGVMARRPSRA